MSNIDFDEVIMVCKIVREELEELSILCTSEELKNPLFGIDFSGKVGTTPEGMLGELDTLLAFLQVRDAGAIEGRDWYIFDLVNYYDMLIETTHPKDAIGDENEIECLRKRRNMAGRLAQFVCQIGEGD